MVQRRGVAEKDGGEFVCGDGLEGRNPQEEKGLFLDDFCIYPVPTLGDDTKTE